MEENKRIRNFFILFIVSVLFAFCLDNQEKGKLSEEKTETLILGAVEKIAASAILKVEEPIKQVNERVFERVWQKANEKAAAQMESYYGTYRIADFYPVIDYVRFEHTCITWEEVTMMLGRIVIIEEDLLFTCDADRRLGSRDGRLRFPGNHVITEYVINNPQYSCRGMHPIENRWDREWIEYLSSRGIKIFGAITVRNVVEGFGGQTYLMVEDENKLVMYSYLHMQYFLLERIEEIPLESLLDRELEEGEKEEIRQSIYGSYTVTDFLPTKFYPALGGDGNELLPEEEAELMLGKEILLSKNSCIIYDNWRRPNSRVQNRLEDGYWVKEVEITEPEYQIVLKKRSKIYGLRNEMLPEEMVQEEYIEISVYPGFDNGEYGARTLPQFYLLNDGRLLARLMEQYFLLEKNVD